jgi:membrane-associated protease RseP (regulator of RpoE activity)
MGILGNGGDASLPGGFHMPFFGSTLNVGALVEPLTSQMAEYLGVPSGVMVKQVARKSEAAAAGLQAFDVILKVGTEAITNLSAWDRALRANQGKPVQVIILRDKKQQTLTLQVDSKHRGALELEEIFPAEDLPAVAVEIDANELEQLKQQMDGLRKSFNPDDFKIDPKQMDELRQQMEQWKRQMEEIKALQFGNYV